jgi:uncharacterized protein
MLIEQIKYDLDIARRQHDKLTLSLLTTLLADIQLIGKNALRETSDIEALSIIKKFVKNIDETLLLALDSHQDLKNQLNQEKIILNKYLPKQLDENDLRIIIQRYITIGIDTLPKMMRELKEVYPGQYDGTLASKLIKELLT